MSVDKTPAQLNAGTASDTSVVHSSQGDVSNQSFKHAERDISRLQGTAPVYNSGKTYNINDLVNQAGFVYKCITAITVAETFDPAKWKFVGNAAPPYSSAETYDVGELTVENDVMYRCSTQITTPEVFDRSKWTVVWQTEDIVHIFEESDFPALVSGTHPLEDGKLYVIDASFTLNDSLRIPVGGTIGIVSPAKQQHKIGVPDGKNLFNTITNTKDILSFADSGGDLLITTSAAHTLSPGDLVNIKADTVSAYTQLKATVIATPDTDEFTIAGTFTVTDTGIMDQGALNVTIDNLYAFQIPSMSFGISFGAFMTFAERSIFRMSNTTLQDWAIGGFINGGSDVVLSDCIMNMDSGSFLVENSAIVTIYNCLFEFSQSNSAALILEGQENIQQYTVADCTFDTTNTAFALALSETLLNSTGIYGIFNNVDTNITHDTLFLLTGTGRIDETHPQVKCIANVRQINSLCATSIEYPNSAGPLDFAVPVNTLTATTTTSWVENFAQRFSLDTGPITGVFTYNGLEDIQVMINYNASLMPETSNQTIFGGMFKNGTEIAEGRFTIQDVDTSSFALVSHSFITELVTGDTLQFGVGNENTAEDVYINEQVSITVNKLT